MIRINLLPHREEKRKRREQQFAVLGGLTALLGVVVAGAVWLYLDAQVTQQRQNVAYMKAEIAKLDKQIEEIRKIREETAALLAKKRVVESLQANRSEPVQLLDQLLRQLPEGVYLKSIKQTGQKVALAGYAQSNSRVSTLMRNLESSPYLEGPGLVEVKATQVGGARTNEFTLNVNLTRPKSNDGAKPAPKSAARR